MDPSFCKSREGITWLQLFPCLLHALREERSRCEIPPQLIFGDPLRTGLLKPGPIYVFMVSMFPLALLKGFVLSKFKRLKKKKGGHYGAGKRTDFIWKIFPDGDSRVRQIYRKRKEKKERK